MSSESFLLPDSEPIQFKVGDSESAASYPATKKQGYYTQAGSVCVECVDSDSDVRLRVVVLE